MLSSSARQLDEVLRALADPTRRHLYGRIAMAPGLSTAQLSEEIVAMSRWGVMKHLEVLRAAGLIQTLPQGRRRRHYPEPAALGPLRAWLAGSDENG